MFRESFICFYTRILTRAAYFSKSRVELHSEPIGAEAEGRGREAQPRRRPRDRGKRRGPARTPDGGELALARRGPPKETSHSLESSLSLAPEDTGKRTCVPSSPRGAFRMRAPSAALQILARRPRPSKPSPPHPHAPAPQSPVLRARVFGE